MSDLVILHPVAAAFEFVDRLGGRGALLLLFDSFNFQLSLGRDGLLAFPFRK